MDANSEKGKRAEEYVTKIAQIAFLKHWCIPNPKYFKGTQEKELCDLLVLFKDVCIIMQVRDYKFDGDYEKYHKKTIYKMIDQIAGGERRMFKSNEELVLRYLENKKLTFDKTKYTKITRIAINMGEGDELYPPSEFTIKDEFVHIFNKDAYEVVATELDTIYDLIKYLEKRQIFLETDTVKILEGKERDLLALYLLNNKSFPSLLMSDEPDRMIILLDGQWDEYINNDQVNLKKVENKYSSFFDFLINETVPKLNADNFYEELAIELASFDRFERRVISKRFFNFLDSSRSNKPKTFRRYSFNIKNHEIVFVYYSPDLIGTKPLQFLAEFAIKFPMIKKNYSMKKIILIGICLEDDLREHFMMNLHIVEKLSDDEEKEAEEVFENLGWNANLKVGRLKEKEYPDIVDEVDDDKSDVN